MSKHLVVILAGLGLAARLMSASAGLAADQTPEQLQDELLLSELDASLDEAERPWPFLLVDDMALWPAGATLRVCFHPLSAAGSQGTSVKELAARRFVVQAVAAWDSLLSVDFDFGAEPYRDCVASTQVDISIAFEGGRFPYWSVIGKASKSFATSMYLGTTRANIADATGQLLPVDGNPSVATARGLVLHEFGHALGFQHEMFNGDADCGAKVDPAKAEELAREMWGVRIPAGLTDEEDIKREKQRILDLVKFQIMRTLEGKAYACTPYDNQSIMGYPLRAYYFKEDGASCASYAPRALTEQDSSLSAKAYPATQAEQEAFKRDFAACGQARFLQAQFDSVLRQFD